jgi:hypothetical protein
MHLPILPGSILIKGQADDGLQNSQCNDELFLRWMAHDLVFQSPQDINLLSGVSRVSDLCYPGQSSHFGDVVDGKRSSK